MTDSMTMPQTAHAHDDLDYITTDSGNADRLIREHGQDFRYCEPLGGWLHWSGVRWQQDENAVWDAAERVGKAILREAAEAEDRNDANRLWQHGRYTLSASGMRQMINLASKKVAVGAGLFDADPYLLNCLNGTVDLHTGELRDHRRDDLITKLALVLFNEDATAPTWDGFIRRVLPDEDVRVYVQKAVGQALTGKVPEQAFYVNHGFGMNGKSTFFDTILTLLGDYAGTIDIDVLMARKQVGGTSPELADLKGKRLVVASENQAGQRLNEGLIKRITGDRTVQARALYQAPMTFDRQFKLFMQVNHRPEIAGTDYAIWRRVRLIPWTARISNEEKDPRLLDKLEQELPGILRWMLEGFKMYMAEGLEPPQAVEQATKDYRNDMDKLTQFINEECVTGGANLYVPKNNLYSIYKAWCEAVGVHPEQKRKFGERMIEKGYDPDEREQVNGTQTRVWRGIGLVQTQ